MEEINEQQALAFLLTNDTVFLNNGRNWFNEELTTCVYVNASDVFVWGSADGENILASDEDDSEILALYNLVKEDQKYGDIKWLCKKRNEQPQDPLKDRMIAAGSWNEELEALPVNRYWATLKQPKK